MTRSCASPRAALRLAWLVGLSSCVGAIGRAGDRGDARATTALDGAAPPLDAAGDGAFNPPPDVPPPPEPPSAGRTAWERTVQPLIAARCGGCHLGARFGVVMLARAGADFTTAETDANYRAFRNQIALDNPRHSRLLAKILPPEDPRAIPHAAGPFTREGDELYTALLGWIEQEKRDRCPDCGASAPMQYLAYVRQPAIHWSIPREPRNENYGERTGARVMLQPIDPGSFSPRGAPIDFLPASFCGPDGQCDFGHLAVNHAGNQLAFECRVPVPGGSYFDADWNVCVAEIGPDGHAVNPRFLMPAARRHTGRTFARCNPLGMLGPDGNPLHGPYDGYYRTRRRSDMTPAFSPDDRRVYVSSRAPDPRTGADAAQSYHGDEHANHLVAATVGGPGGGVDGGDLRTIYLNEGGTADYPFFLRNGNLAIHTWNLERMDRHMYVQSTADGMMELPVLLGHLQGENMWGRAFQMANGLIFGITGRRRAQMDTYVPFTSDHTLGIGALDPALRPLVVLDEALLNELHDYDFCNQTPALDGPGCVLSHFFDDASYSPDGRAFVAYTPNRVSAAQGEDFMNKYARGDALADRQASVAEYLPRDLGIALMDHHGRVEPFVHPEPGFMLRYPTWIGRREAPVVQPWRTDETQHEAEIHIADFPLWLLFGRSGYDRDLRTPLSVLDRITSVRVLVKALDGNAGTNDMYPYREAVNSGRHDHPTHLGINNATGYTQLVAAPGAGGGDAYGDVPLAADRSVRLRVPAGQLLLFQGVDADGHTVSQHTRVFALPPGQRVDTSVRRAQYRDQCASCHGAIDDQPFPTLATADTRPAAPLDYGTAAMARPAVDLASAAVTRRPLTYLHTVRPLLDRACVSCHSGAAPAGELTFEREYSATANYPAGRWADPALTNPDYLAFVPPSARVPGYAYSVAYSFLMRNEDPPYRAQYAAQIAAHAPLAALAPWDPGYQSLYAQDAQGFLYLSGIDIPLNFGRSDRVGGNSRDSFLIEILTGRDLNPTRAFGGPDHTHYLGEAEVRQIMAVIDVGFPFMLRGADRRPTSGPNAGAGWADAVASGYR